MPERWADALLAALNHISAKLAAEVAHALISGGKLDALKELLARLISQHQATSEFLLWLARSDPIRSPTSLGRKSSAPC